LDIFLDGISKELHEELPLHLAGLCDSKSRPFATAALPFPSRVRSALGKKGSGTRPNLAWLAPSSALNFTGNTQNLPGLPSYLAPQGHATVQPVAPPEGMTMTTGAASTLFLV